MDTFLNILGSGAAVLGVFVTYAAYRLRRRFSLNRKYAANNAVLAEYSLQFIELVPENTFVPQLTQAIFQTLRRGLRSSEPDEAMAAFFNRLPRFEQLNHVARALHDLGS